MIIKCTTQVWAGFWWYHQDGYFRRGRRIAVNARSAGQHRGKVSKGKQKILQGRPKGMRIASFPDVNEMQLEISQKEKQSIHYKKALLMELKMQENGSNLVNVCSSKSKCSV